MSETILNKDYSEVMEKSYIDYSMSVLTARALPDVRDGLKPVQRRILFAMSELNNTPDKPHRKSARIVGDTMGKYHPHGDASIYDALVVMGQKFKKNQTLVDAHGNFGSIEGDGAAASRYTEARLEQFTCDILLRDLDKDTVDFAPNFDGTEKEPTVLPAILPNILVNGADGIAVGMTTSIPSHNIGELIDAEIALIDNPNITVEGLMQYIKGPDWPTGGIVINQKDLLDIYKTGTGKIKLRAKLEFEKSAGKNGKHKLVITEIPYTMIGSGMNNLFTVLEQLIKEKKLPEISDVSNVSDKNGIRIILELKNGADVDRIKNILYKKTKLEDTFGVNMLAVVDGRPEVMSLKDILEKHLNFSYSVNVRKYETLLKNEYDKKEIQEGLVRAIDIIDLIIEIIRNSKNRKEAQACLMGQPNSITFKTKKSQEAVSKLDFTERQAGAILDLRLSRLIGLEITALQKEYKDTLAKIEKYKKFLSKKNAMMTQIKADLQEMKKFARERKTVITNEKEAENIKIEIPEQDIVLCINRLGYVKCIDQAAYERNREFLDEENKTILATKNTGRLRVFTNRGFVYQIKMLDVPLSKPRDKGTPLETFLKWKEKGETPVGFYAAPSSDLPLLFLTRLGFCKKVAPSEFETASRVMSATKLQPEDELILVSTLSSPDIICLMSNESAVKISAEEIAEKKKSSIGNSIIKLPEGTEIKSAINTKAEKEGEITIEGKTVSFGDVVPKEKWGKIRKKRGKK